MVVEVNPGRSPLVLAMPHTGTFVPAGVGKDLNARGHELADTDWHIDRLYAGLAPDATTVRATFHRYVIDANRDPSGDSLYPGQNTTGLCPLTDFDGNPIYQDGSAPDAGEIQRRLDDWHRPYHEALAEQIDRVRALHGYAVLWDCHSIRSHVPFLFEGELPVLNIGTNGGTTCAPDMEDKVADLARDSGLDWVLNGRFKGGWTTRHYGQPDSRVHAIQMETAQRAYLAEEAPPWSYDVTRADQLRDVLTAMLAGVVRAAQRLYC